ncbi:MAG TPA: hypothetical protein VH394_00495, partial [Thermoanaerobaculia bacterium]|nr:hypothetical protein [Thermoanaerobaculia bacterium]
MDIDATLLGKLQALNERELTFDILMPILKTLGYVRVEYHGGATEEGKDLVCWREDEFGDPELTVMQVKKFKLSRRAADTKSLSEIVTQLSQCYEKSIGYIDGQRYRPSIVYLASPYAIDSQVLQSRFEGIEALRRQRVRVMDGPRIVQILRRKLPHQLLRLRGSLVDLRESFVPQLTNADLMDALNLRADRPLAAFYTDIDICPGRETTRLFLTASFVPVRLSETVDVDLWPALREINLLGARELNVRIVGNSESSVELEAGIAQKARASWAARLASAREQLNAAAFKIRGEVNRELERMTRLLPQSTACRDSLERISRNLNSYEVNRAQGGLSNITAQVEKVNRDLKGVNEGIEGRVLFSQFPEEPPFGIYLGDFAKYEICEAKVLREKPDTSLVIDIDGVSLALALNAEREKVKAKVASLNLCVQNRAAELKAFLLDCSRLLDATGIILSNQLISKAVGITPETQYRTEAGKYRLRLPISEIFDTGVNLAILGEAGAGKTTSLQ